MLGVLIRLGLVSAYEVNKGFEPTIFHSEYSRQWDQAALVVRPGALVVERHKAIALEVGDGDDGRVDRQLVVVDAETVTVRVGVGEETGLQNGVRRGLNTGHEV